MSDVEDAAAILTEQRHQGARQTSTGTERSTGRPPAAVSMSRHFATGASQTGFLFDWIAPAGAGRDQSGRCRGHGRVVAGQAVADAGHRHPHGGSSAAPLSCCSCSWLAVSGREQSGQLSLTGYCAGSQPCLYCPDLGFRASEARNVPGFREIRSKPLSRQVSDLDVPNSRIPHEGRGCAHCCAGSKGSYRMALLEARGRRRCALEVAAAALRAAVGTHTLAKPGQIAPLTAAIGLPAMCNTNNEDHQFIVEQFVDHPVVADAVCGEDPANLPSASSPHAVARRGDQWRTQCAHGPVEQSAPGLGSRCA